MSVYLDNNPNAIATGKYPTTTGIEVITPSLKLLLTS